MRISGGVCRACAHWRIARKFGLTIDSLLSADVVTADGVLRHANATENPDPFWALRGGGGNSGVVTAFEFQLHRLGPQVLAGLVVHPFVLRSGLMSSRRSRAFACGFFWGPVSIARNTEPMFRVTARGA